MGRATLLRSLQSKSSAGASLFRRAGTGIVLDSDLADDGHQLGQDHAGGSPDAVTGPNETWRLGLHAECFSRERRATFRAEKMRKRNLQHFGHLGGIGF